MAVFAALLTRITRAGKIFQGTFNGKTKDDIRNLTPYGFFSHPPKNSKIVMLKDNGGTYYGMAYLDSVIPSLEEGEVVGGNFQVGSIVKFDKDGNITITGKKDLNITIDGDCDKDISGDYNLDATNTTITTTNDATISSGNDVIVTAANTANTTATVSITITAPSVVVNSATSTVINSPSVDLGGIGGPAVARVGDTVAGGVITSGSLVVRAV